MKDLGYAYLHCDLLDMAALIIIILRVKSPYIEMHEQHLQKNMFVRVENFNIESNFLRGFEKGDMHVVITIESTIIVLSILVFQLKLIMMFFHMDSIREFKSSIQNWKSGTIVVIAISVRGVRNNKGEKKLLITNGKGEFDQNILAFGNNFKIEHEQFFLSVQWRPLWNGFNKKCDNNNKRRSIFESTTLHNFNKGCGQSYLNLSFTIT